jgi:CBS domain-containing protein
MRVEKIMTRDVLTTAPETPLKDVALLLSANHVSGVPVCAPDGSVLGIVSEADILRREQGFSLLAPEAFRLTVDGGVVTIRGTVRTAADAKSLTRCLRGVPGVLEVKSKLDVRESGSARRTPLRLIR